ncbi:hypothetical protein MTO96_017776 [Rhipicephalus appendiculatus]
MLFRCCADALVLWFREFVCHGGSFKSNVRAVTFMVSAAYTSMHPLKPYASLSDVSILGNSSEAIVYPANFEATGYAAVFVEMHHDYDDQRHADYSYAHACNIKKKATVFKSHRIS